MATLDYRKPMERKWRRPTTVEILVLIGIGALLISIILPTLQRYREAHTRLRCPSNLRHLGQALLLYEVEQKSVFPPDLKTLYLVSPQYVSPEVFVCDGTDDTAAKGTPEQIAAQLTGPPHCSYIYRGAGLRFSMKSDYILAYEPRSNHDGQGSNALRLDGSVVFLTPSELEAALRIPATNPTSHPTSRPSE